MSWATASIIMAVGGWIPLLVSPSRADSFVANRLPEVLSRAQLVAMGGLFIALYLSLKTLPPRPKRYKAHRSFWMIAQWVYLPVVSLAYGSASGLYSQTRLILGKYLGFVVTEKIVRKDKP